MSRKLLHNWLGPYRIVEQSSPVHFRLRTDTNKKVTFAVHANRMKPFIDQSLRPIDPPLFDDPNEPYLDESDIPDDCFESELLVDKNIDSTLPASVPKNSSTQSDQQNRPVQPQLNADHSVIDDESIFRAERILKSRKKKGKTEYLVKWHNYPRNQSTWEPEQIFWISALLIISTAQGSSESSYSRFIFVLFFFRDQDCIQSVFL